MNTIPLAKHSILRAVHRGYSSYEAIAQTCKMDPRLVSRNVVKLRESGEVSIAGTIGAQKAILVTLTAAGRETLLRVDCGEIQVRDGRLVQQDEPIHIWTVPMSRYLALAAERAANDTQTTAAAPAPAAVAAAE